MSRFQTVGANIVIALYLAICVIDAPPAVAPWHGQLKARLDPFIDAAGLWQESWRLFAPEPKKINVRVSAKFYLEDGLLLEWESPRWHALNLLEKHFSVRHMKFYDLLPMDANRAAWRSFAEYRRSRLPDAVRDQVVRVELWRHWRITPAPDQEWLPAGEWVELNEQESFFFVERR